MNIVQILIKNTTC